MNDKSVNAMMHIDTDIRNYLYFDQRVKYIFFLYMGRPPIGNYINRKKIQINS